MDEKDIAKALELFEERQAKKDAEAKEAEAARKAIFEEGRKAGLEAGKAEAVKWEEGKAPAYMKTAKPGSGGENGDVNTFWHYVRSGDVVAARKSLDEVTSDEDRIQDNPNNDPATRKALSQLTGAAGQFLVPEDVASPIDKQIYERSFPRQMGVRVYNTGRRVVDLPAESTAISEFTRTAELGSYTSDDPAFGQNQVTVQDWTKATQFSNDLLDDEDEGLQSWYQSQVAEAAALTEAHYVAVGSGTNQHQGIFAGGDTDAMVFNTDNGLSSDDIAAGAIVSFNSLWQFYFTLGEGYAENGAWLMNRTTLRNIVALASTSIPIFQASQLLSQNNIPSSGWNLLGRPVFTNSNVSDSGSSTCFIAFGDPMKYTLVQRRGMVVLRNPYMTPGAVSLYTSFRQSGKVTQQLGWVLGQGA